MSRNSKVIASFLKLIPATAEPTEGPLVDANQDPRAVKPPCRKSRPLFRAKTAIETARALRDLSLWPIVSQRSAGRYAGWDPVGGMDQPQDLDVLADQTKELDPSWLGVLLRLGPGRGPDHSWLIAIDGNGPEGLESLRKLWGSATPDTMGWETDQDFGKLACVDGTRIRALTSASKLVLASFPRLKIRLGGDPDGHGGEYSNTQAFCPPTTGISGRPRVWHRTTRIREVPEKFYQELAPTIQKQDVLESDFTTNLRIGGDATTGEEDGYTYNQVREALQCLSPNCDRDDWLRTAGACKALGEAGFQLRLDWSFRANEWTKTGQLDSIKDKILACEQRCRQAWATLRSGGGDPRRANWVGLSRRDLGSLFYDASQQGFQLPPRYDSPTENGHEERHRSVTPKGGHPAGSGSGEPPGSPSHDRADSGTACRAESGRRGVGTCG